MANAQINQPNLFGGFFNRMRRRYNRLNAWLIVLILTGFILLLWPFWAALTLAMITALGLQKVKGALLPRTKIVEGRLATVFIIFVLLISFGFLGLIGVKINTLWQESSADGNGATITSDALLKLRYGYEQVTDIVVAALESWGLAGGDQLRQYMHQLPGQVLAQIAILGRTLIVNIPKLLLDILVYLIAVYYLLNNARAIRYRLLRLKLTRLTDFNLLGQIAEDAAFAALITNLVIGIVQACIVSAGATMFGYQELALIFFTTVVLGFVPFLGGGSVAFALALTSYISGEIFNSIGLLVTAAITGSIDNVLRAHLVSTYDIIHPTLSFIVLIGAIIVLGLPGLFIGPFFVAFCGFYFAHLGAKDVYRRHS